MYLPDGAKRAVQAWFPQQDIVEKRKGILYISVLHPEVPLLPPKMRLLSLVSVPLLLLRVLAQLHPEHPAAYFTLPPLREQAAILDGWRDERVARIPHILRKYGVDAWLVNISEPPQRVAHTPIADEPTRICRRHYLVVYQSLLGPVGWHSPVCSLSCIAAMSYLAGSEALFHWRSRTFGEPASRVSLMR